MTREAVSFIFDPRDKLLSLHIDNICTVDLEMIAMGLYFFIISVYTYVVLQ